MVTPQIEQGILVRDPIRSQEQRFRSFPHNPRQIRLLTSSSQSWNRYNHTTQSGISTRIQKEESRHSQPGEGMGFSPGHSHVLKTTVSTQKQKSPAISAEPLKTPNRFAFPQELAFRSVRPPKAFKIAARAACWRFNFFRDPASTSN